MENRARPAMALATSSHAYCSFYSMKAQCKQASLRLQYFTYALKDYLFILTHKFRRSILKKSDVSKVVFREAKDGTRSHLKGFCAYSSIGGSTVGPKWAENPTFSSYTVISVLKIQNTASAWKNLGQPRPP